MPAWGNNGEFTIIVSLSAEGVGGEIHRGIGQSLTALSTVCRSPAPVVSVTSWVLYVLRW